LRAYHGADFDAMMIDPQQAEMMKEQAMQQAALGGAPGATRGNAMKLEQYQQLLPKLRAIQGGKGRTPQR